MKKALLITLGVVAAATLAVTGLFLVLRMNRDPAKVYSVSELSTVGDDYGGEMLNGTVMMDRMQTVFLSQTQTVTELLVEPGQRVQKGDAMLRFDTSLSELSLSRKELEIRQLERDLEKEKTEYNSLAGKKVYPTYAQLEEPGVYLSWLAARVWGERSMEPPEPVDIGGEVTWPAWLPTEFDPSSLTEPHEEPTTTEAPETTEATEATEAPGTAETQESSAEEPSESASGAADESSESESSAPEDPAEESTGWAPDAPNYPRENYLIVDSEIISGSGTMDDPYVVAVAQSFEVCDVTVHELLGDGNSAWAVLCQCQDDYVDLPVTAAYGMHFIRAGNAWKMQLFDASAFVGMTLVESMFQPDETESPEESEDPGYIDPGMPEDERKARMEELAASIREKELQLRMLQLELKKMQRELTDGVVYADFDGTVLTVNDPDEAYRENLPVVKVSGGGGYLVESSISELRLEEIYVGQSVTLNSWTYGSCTGTVTEISDVPTGNMYWSDGNSNVSYYGFTVEVDDTADLMEGDWMEIQLQSDGEAHGFYLQDAFLLQENGKSYVFVRGENELLEKREVVTGGKLWGQYTEILSGLTQEDLIAFPYAKATEAGAKTVEGTLDELYGWG